MKKLITYLIVIVVLGGGGYYYYKSRQVPQVPEFAKAVISQGNVVEIVQATGTLQADRIMPVGSKVSGVIDELYTDFNQVVRAGQVLAQINTDQLQTQVEIQKANIARQEVDLAQQEVQLADAKMNLERQQRLFEAKLTTQQALEAAKLQVSAREAQIASAIKSKVQSEANLAQAELNVKEATIVSPIDGVVINRVVDRGQTIVGSQQATKFFDIATDLTKLRLEGGVDEAEIGKIRTNMVVRFSVDTYPNTEFEGTVSRIRLNPSTQNNVVTYTTVVEVRNNDLRLKPGMTAQMRIEVLRKDNTLRVPAAALRFRPTNDMWTALKQEPPTPPGRMGGPGGPGGRNGGGQPQSAAPAPAPGGATTAQPAATQASAQPAAQGNNDAGPNPFQRGGGREGGRQGGGMGMNLTPEQQKAMEAIRQLPQEQRAEAMRRAGINFGGGNGRAGGMGRGGRGGNNTPAAAPAPQRAGQMIDELFPPLERNPTRSQVYVLRPADTEHPFGKLERLDIMIGISDGTFTAIESAPAELTTGSEVITNIMMPWLQTTSVGGSNQNNPFSGQQGRGGMQGMGGMGGGGNPGGGGGGRGGGGGGGR